MRDGDHSPSPPPGSSPASPALLRISALVVVGRRPPAGARGTARPRTCVVLVPFLHCCGSRTGGCTWWGRVTRTCCALRSSPGRDVVGGGLTSSGAGSPGLVAHRCGPSCSGGGWVARFTSSCCARGSPRRSWAVGGWLGSPALVAHRAFLSVVVVVGGRVHQLLLRTAGSSRLRSSRGGALSPALVAHGSSSSVAGSSVGRRSPGLVAHCGLLPGRASVVVGFTRTCCSRGPPRRRVVGSVVTSSCCARGAPSGPCCQAGRVTRTCCALRAPSGRTGWSSGRGHQDLLLTGSSSSVVVGRVSGGHQLLLRTSRSSRVGPAGRVGHQLLLRTSRSSPRRPSGPGVVTSSCCSRGPPGRGGCERSGGHQLLLRTSGLLAVDAGVDGCGHQDLLRTGGSFPKRRTGGLGGHQLLLRTVTPRPACAGGLAGRRRAWARRRRPTSTGVGSGADHQLLLRTVNSLRCGCGATTWRMFGRLVAHASIPLSVSGNACRIGGSCRCGGVRRGLRGSQRDEFPGRPERCSGGDRRRAGTVRRVRPASSRPRGGGRRPCGHGGNGWVRQCQLLLRTAHLLLRWIGRRPRSVTPSTFSCAVGLTGHDRRHRDQLFSRPVTAGRLRV